MGDPRLRPRFGRAAIESGRRRKERDHMKMAGLGRYSAAVGAMAVCASLLAACSVRSNVDALPNSSPAGGLDAVAHKRGTVKTFNDPFGDPAPAGITAGPDGAL